MMLYTSSPDCGPRAMTDSWNAHNISLIESQYERRHSSSCLGIPENEPPAMILVCEK